MEAIIVTIFFFLGAIAISAVLFVVWVIWSVLRILGTVFFHVLFGRRKAPVMIEAKPLNVMVCPNPRCRDENPTGARFCRRCGSEMPGAQHVLARRAAMW
jgi:ribosomal protein L40E